MSAAVVSFQWFFWGYSLTFSHDAGRFIGDLSHIGFRNVLARPSVGSPDVPDLVYAVYQGMFAAVTYVDLSSPLLLSSPLPSCTLHRGEGRGGQLPLQA